MGFPARSSFDALGGVRENQHTVTNSRTQIDAPWTNEVGWQVTGMNKISGLVTLVVAADGSRTSGGEAWNPEDDPDLRVEITKSATGVYVIAAQAATYPDWTETERAVVFNGALVTPLSATSVRVPTYTRDSATQITVRTWNGSGVAADLPFTIDIR